jgi:diguanylate cyclase (GGDEF)-like protein
MFKLRPYLLMTSLVSVLAVIAGLLYFYRYIAFQSLQDNEKRASVALTQTFANDIWPRYETFIAESSAIAPDQLSSRAEISRLRADILRLVKGLHVVKVKLYNLDGVTVFSSVAKEIGTNKSDNAGFRSARAGETVSDITFREKFDAFEQTIADRNLVYSYIPVRKDENAGVDGVVEVYSDVSELVANLNRTQWQIAAAVLGSLSLLYLVLYFAVGRADKIISAQSRDERNASREKLQHQATHDSTTGLPNRALFIDLLDQAVARAKRSGQRFAVLILDIDNFKDLNDALGHSVGDRLLREIGKRIKERVSDADIIARVGADEFGALLIRATDATFAAGVARSLCEYLAARRYKLGQQHFAITASVGIGVYPRDGRSAPELLTNAEAAMYHAKKMGRNNWQFYHRDMNAQASTTLSLEGGLREAMEHDALFLHYQPFFDMASGHLVGAEALVRWTHPEMGPIAPGRFLPIAEERGLLVSIGDWVLREACRQNRAWHDVGFPRLPIAVNIAATQLRQNDFVQKVKRMLGESGLDPSYLELEIAEATIAHATDAIVVKLRDLKTLGVKLTIDNFGTGYSNPGYLKQFPLDRLKLDRTFVHGLPANQENAIVSNAVLDMARALQLKVTAEGVESKAQLDFLSSRRCAEAQGYYFSHPLPAVDFAKLIMGSASSTFTVAARAS